MSENAIPEDAKADAEEKRENHIRGVFVTAFSSIMGVVAGIVSWAITSGNFVELGLGERGGLYVVGFFILLQYPFMPYFGKDDMGAKDYIYIVFMTTMLWYISWTIILTG